MPTTIQAGLPLTISSLSQFITYGRTISNAFSTFGWVKSSDTGQVNWATISSIPTTVGTFEVWTPGDALPAVYVRIDYWSTGTLPYLQISIGYATNGAGALVGVTWSSGNMNTSQATSGQTIAECDFAGDSSRMSMLLFRASVHPMLFTIERSRDNTGSNTNAFLVGLWGYNGSAKQFIVDPNYPIVWTETTPLAVHTSNTTGITTSGTTKYLGVTPFWPVAGAFSNPMLGAMCIKSGDLPDGAMFAATLYGTSHNYICCSSVGGTWSPQGGSVAVRFD